MAAVMAEVDWQLDRICNQLRDKPLGMSVEDLLDD